MPIGNSCIHSQANACITAATTRELAQISGLFTENSVESVACIAALPSAELNKGRMIFVNDISAYRYSNGGEWTNDYDTTVLTQIHLFGWGSNLCCNLGNPTIATAGADCFSSPIREFCSATNWSGIFVGYSCSTGVNALKDDGTIWGWGGNNSGVLGVGTTVASIVSPVQEVTSSTNWCYITKSPQNFGNCNAFWFKTDGTMWGTGSNYCYALMDGTFTTRCSPVQECTSSTNWSTGSQGFCQSSAIKTDGSMWVIGHNGYGLLGMGDTVNRTTLTREYTSSTNWCAVNYGFYGRSAIKTDGSLWSVGHNGVGSNGGYTSGVTDHSSPVREFCSATNWSSVCREGYAVRAIKTDGTLWGWGSGGLSTGGNACSAIQEQCSATNWCQVSVGGKPTTAGLKTDGTLWFWDYDCLGNTTHFNINRCNNPIQECTSDTNWCYVATSTKSSHALKQAYLGFNEP